MTIRQRIRELLFLSILLLVAFITGCSPLNGVHRTTPVHQDVEPNDTTHTPGEPEPSYLGQTIYLPLEHVTIYHGEYYLWWQNGDTLDILYRRHHGKNVENFELQPVTVDPGNRNYQGFNTMLSVKGESYASYTNRHVIDAPITDISVYGLFRHAPALGSKAWLEVSPDGENWSSVSTFDTATGRSEDGYAQVTHVADGPGDTEDVYIRFHPQNTQLSSVHDELWIRIRLESPQDAPGSVGFITYNFNFDEDKGRQAVTDQDTQTSMKLRYREDWPNQGWTTDPEAPYAPWHYQMMTPEEGYYIRNLQDVAALPAYEVQGNFSTEIPEMLSLADRPGSASITVKAEFEGPIEEIHIWSQCRVVEETGQDVFFEISADNSNWVTKSGIGQDFTSWCPIEFAGRVNNLPGQYEQGPVIISNMEGFGSDDIPFLPSDTVYIRWRFESPVASSPPRIPAMNSLGILAKAYDGPWEKDTAADWQPYRWEEDKVLRVNGEPFFPILYFAYGESCVTDEVLAAASEAGFNVIAAVGWRIMPTVYDLLERAAQYDMYVITRSWNRVAPNPGETYEEWEGRFKDWINHMKGHPGLLGYFLADEPLWSDKPFDQIQTLYELHRRVDPERPVWVNHAPRNTVEDLAKWDVTHDVTGVDIYPVPEGGGHSEMDDRTISSVGRYTLKMREVVDDRKPVWMVLQAFAWASYKNQGDYGYDGSDSIYPTWEQTRFMAYDAIVHGAKGIAYWGMQFIMDPSFWDTLYGITAELSEMSNILTASTIEPSPVNVEGEGLLFLHKVYNGADYIIAINPTKSPVDASFSVPFGEEEVYVLFEEDRALTVSGGIFSDTFAPNDVHIYTNILRDTD